VSKRGEDPLPTDLSRREAKSNQGYQQQPENGYGKDLTLEK